MTKTIKWTDGERIVPGIGRINTGDVRTIDKALADSLIDQKQAVETKEKKPESRDPAPADEKEQGGDD